MKKLGQLLGSAARTELLRVLVHCPGPVGLRHAAGLAGVRARSAELALRALVEEGIVRRRQAGGPLYELNRSHPDIAVLEAVFEAARCAELKRRTAALQERAAAILPFIAEANRMLARAVPARTRTRSGGLPHVAENAL